MYNITFQQIEAFLATAKVQNLTRASENLYISQPALSKILQRFERGIGFEVFERKAQGVALTLQGEYLYRTINSLYDRFNSAIDYAGEISIENERRLHIGLPSSYDITEGFAPVKKLLKQFETAYPDIILNESLHNYSELRRLFETRELDLVLSENYSFMDIPDSKCEVICKYPLYLVLASTHPLATCDMPSPDELKCETVYQYDERNNDLSRERLLTICNMIGFQPKRIEFVDNLQTYMHVLLSEKGISFCGRFRDPSGDLKFYSLNNIAQDATCSIVWQEENLKGTTKTFLTYLMHEYLPHMGPV